jgi:hypothetical protein
MAPEPVRERTSGRKLGHMRIAVSPDLDEPVARLVVAELHRRGHTVVGHGALRAADRHDRAQSAESAARRVVDDQAGQADVYRWTGTDRDDRANAAHLAEFR